MKTAIIGITLAGLLVRAAAAESPLGSAAELNAFLAHGFSSDRPFAVTGTLAHVIGSGIILRDSTASTWFANAPTNGLADGDDLVLTGTARLRPPYDTEFCVDSCVRTGRSPLPPPADIALDQVDDARNNFCDVRVCGTVIDVLEDEADPDYAVLILRDRGASLPVFLEKTPIEEAFGRLGARIAVTGIFYRTVRGARKYSGPYLAARSIEQLVPPPDDPFDVPELESVWYRSPAEVAALRPRRIAGTVLATWRSDRLIVRDTIGRIVNVRLAARSPLPAEGTAVEVVGLPQTDLYRINLAHARWRASALAARAEEPPETVDAEAIQTRRGDRTHINNDYHGRLVRLRGIVRSLPAEGDGEKRILVESGSARVQVDCSSVPAAVRGVANGALVEITGYCLIETSDWSAQDVFPQATGFSVVIRRAEDLRIVSRPPWWTPARLAVVVLVLLGALGGFVLWNFSLQALAKRRARQLADAEVAQVGSELRVGERTRLAVELHDSLSQTLTGVAMEIRSANKTPDDAPERRRAHLALAARAVDACREELRHCLWDLRNNTLETADMNEAIRQTLAPHIGDTALSIRFNVPRAAFTDNSAHTVLRIVRELANNAIRHGHATEIHIAGTAEHGKLLFSVRDNGCGFDVDRAAGPEQGHFGLQGIRERINTIGGTFALHSTIGGGTKAVVTLNAPHAKDILA